jgi:energy-coupling factor transporter transmembrane protein EcfT
MIAIYYDKISAHEEAHLARGLPGRPFLMIFPMLMRTIQRASEIADAIDARRP